MFVPDTKVAGVAAETVTLSPEMSASAERASLRQCGNAFVVRASSDPLPTPLAFYNQGYCEGRGGNASVAIRRWSGDYWDSTELCEQAVSFVHPVSDLFQGRGKAPRPGTYAVFVKIRKRDEIPVFNAIPDAIGYVANKENLTAFHPRSMTSYRLPFGAVIRSHSGTGGPAVFKKAACGIEDEVPIFALPVLSTRTWQSDIRIGPSESATGALVCDGAESCDLIDAAGTSTFHFPEASGSALEPIGVNSNGTAAVGLGEWESPAELGGMKVIGSIHEIWIWTAKKGLEKRKVGADTDPAEWWRKLMRGEL